MKDQASLNLKIVDTPISKNALDGHLMLSATSTGLKLYDHTGAETPIGGEVDESRLLPTGAKDGDLLIKSAEIVGNDYNDSHTVLFIQGSTANAAAADSPLPVTWNNQPAVQEDNTLLLTGSTQLSTASAPEVKRVFGGEFTVEAYLKPTQFNNTSRQDTNFFYLNGPSTYYIYLSNYNNSGNAENGKFGLWVYSGNRQITLNNGEFHHVALDVYMEGSTRKYTIYYDGVAVQTDTWYNDGVADSTNAIIRFFSSSDGAELNNCYLKSIRVSDIARYKGKSFTPPANGLYLPAPDGEWITINKSQLVAQDDVKLNPDPVKVPAGKYGFSPALRNVDLVNGDTTKLYINPNLSGKEIKDIAAGTSTPHTFVNHNVTVSESTGAMVFDGSSSYLEIDPSDIITEGQEWCLDLYLKTTRYDSKIMNIRTWTDSGQEFSIWIRSSGEISVHSSPLGTGVVGKAIPLNEEFRFTLEQYIENSVWKLAMYVNGEHFGTVDAELHRYHSNTVLGKGYNDPWMSGEISRVIWRTEAPYKGTNFTDEAATELSYVMPNKVSDVPAGSTVQLNNNGTPVYVEAEKVLLSDAKSTKLNQLDVTRQLPASSADNVTPVYKKQDVIGAMYNDSKVVVLLQGSKVNIAKNAAFQLTGGDEVTVDSDGNLVFNRGNGIIVPAGKFNNENNGQFTVDIMVAVDQLPSSTGSYEYILGNDNSPTYPFNYRVFGDGTVRFQYQNTSHNIQIEQGIFTLLSFDYDGTTLRSYKDGVLVGAQDMTYSAFPNSIGIGTDQYYSHTGFAGRIKYIRMSNIARYRGQAFTAPGLAGYVTPPDGEWVTMPAIGDNRLLPNNPTNGDIPVYTNDFDRSNFNTTDTVCLLQNAGVNQFENVAKGKIGGSRISNYAGSVTIDENGYFVYPGGSGTWIEFIDSGWNANGTGDWTLDVRMIAEATGSSQYFLGPANDGSGDPQAVIRGSGTTGTIRPYEISDMIHDITFGEEFTYSMAWEAATKTLRTWKDGKQMRKKTFTSNGYQFGFKGATEFWLGRNAVDPGLKGKVKYWRLSNAALYGDSEFTPPTDVYQDAPAGAWELVNKSELGGSGDVDESRLLPDSGPDDSWMHHSESMDLVTPTDMTSMQSADWTLTAENVQENFSGKPWGLFDSGSYGFYIDGSGPATCTWTRQDGTPTLIDRLEIYTGSPGNNNGDSYEFYGSQDGNNWTLLGSWSAKWNSDSVKDTETNLNVLTLEVGNSTKYLYYKFSANSPTLERLKGYGVTTKNEWKKFPVATTSAAGLMAAADKAKLDKFGESDGKLTYDGAEIGGASNWNDITGKPETFPPSAHNHAITDVTGLEDALQNAGTVKSVNGQTPDSSGAVTLPEATTSAAGLMAAADKAAVDGMQERGFYPQLAAVPSPVDFDQMTETGFFFIEKGSELTNYPGNNPQTYGTLQVLSAGDNLTQMFLVCGSAGTSVWERNRYRLDNGSLLFTGWRKLMLTTAITESFGSSGYFKLPNGTIAQYGGQLVSGSTNTIQLPITVATISYQHVSVWGDNSDLEALNALPMVILVEPGRPDISKLTAVTKTANGNTWSGYITWLVIGTVQ